MVQNALVDCRFGYMYKSLLHKNIQRTHIKDAHASKPHSLNITDFRFTFKLHLVTNGLIARPLQDHIMGYGINTREKCNLHFLSEITKRSIYYMQAMREDSDGVLYMLKII